jgi:CRISPR/Cas system-associated protein endoribonuclease Cas2
MLSSIKTIKDQEAHAIGHYKGFDILLQRDDLFKQPYIELQGSIRHRIEMGSDVHGNIQRIDNLIKSLPEILEHKVDELSSTEKQIEVVKQEVKKPFNQEFELKQKLIRLDELNHELAMDVKEETQDIGDEDDTPAEKSINTYGLER